MSSLRLRHGLKVHVCSLLSSDFIVSNRMAVEWMRESDVASAQNRRRLQERIQRVQTLHERVCMIIERDRSKPGENHTHGSTCKLLNESLKNEKVLHVE